MPSVRAEEVAEILWELKRAGKVATYSLIADRAGFNAGTNGRAVQTCLRAVRRDWPHLQWWRAIRDDGLLEKGGEQEVKLRECGYEVESATEGEKSEGETSVIVKQLEQHLMDWPGESPAAERSAENLDS